eukprot:GEMP01032688.1.p1 GENE.GEMP01032688.1~~GEMP01032688.1.p1  ORF type:complete len:464 (+),score=72.84 GEMP01032688.1:86-1477(+)
MFPFLVLKGEKESSDIPALGIYELQGQQCGKWPCYRQLGLGSKHRLWCYADWTEGEDPYWVLEDHLGEGLCFLHGDSPWTGQWATAEGIRVPSLQIEFPKAEPPLRVATESPFGALIEGMYQCTGIDSSYHRRYRQLDDELSVQLWRSKGGWVFSHNDHEGNVKTIVARSRSRSKGGESPWEMQWELSRDPMDEQGGNWVKASVSVLQQAYDHSEVRVCGGSFGNLLNGVFVEYGSYNGRPYWVQECDLDVISVDEGPFCIWFAQDRNEWLIGKPEHLGNSRFAYCRIESMAYFPWDCRMPSSPKILNAATAYTLGLSDAEMLTNCMATWEVCVEGDGTKWNPDTSLDIELIVPDSLTISGEFNAETRHLLGEYSYHGMLSSRPVYLGPQALWFCEDRDQWVISKRTSFMDATRVMCRSVSSMLLPWDTKALWEVTDWSGGFKVEPSLQLTPEQPARRRRAES